MYLLRTPRSRGLCVSPTALIALLLITCSAEATPLRDGGLKRGLGANGDLVIHITGATGATCALNYFSILSINTTLCRNHSDAFVLAPTMGVKILTAGSAYHITKTSMESAFRAQGCSEFLSEEVRVSGAYCVNHGVGLTISGPGTWVVSCTPQGYCTTPSGAVTLAIPAG